MNNEVQEIVNRLHEASKQRGRLSQIAADSGVSSRTIYALLHTVPPSATARTIDKLAAYFAKADRKSKK